MRGARNEAVRQERQMAKSKESEVITTTIPTTLRTVKVTSPMRSAGSKEEASRTWLVVKVLRVTCAAGDLSGFRLCEKALNC